MRSCHVQTDFTAIARNLSTEPKQRNEQALTALLRCDPSKKFTQSLSGFRRWKEYAETFPFAKTLGTGHHSIVEVGLQSFDTRRGTIVMTTDIGVFSQLSARDNTLYRWTHSLVSGKAKS